MTWFPRFDGGGAVDAAAFPDPMSGMTPEQAAQGAHWLGDAWNAYLGWRARQPDYVGQMQALAAQGVPWDDPRYLRAAMPLGLGLAGGGILGDAGGAAGAASFPAMLESRVVPGYNSPVKPPRPFAADYPGGAPADGTGRLTTDIDGRPLGAQYVAGRRVGADLGGDDQALTPAEIKSVATSATGEGPQAVASREIRGDAGRLIRTVNPDTGATEWNMAIDRNLSDAASAKVVAHETGHLIDELSGQIPTDGIKTELKQVYNTLNTGRERTTKLTGPQHLGYSGDAPDRELMAEAIRGYMTDPNYLKTVAPRTAATIRAYVNANPRLAPLIQFNAIPAVAGTAGGGQMLSQSNAPPPNRRAFGGFTPSPATQGASPQQLYAQYAQLPLSQLQQLAVSMPPSTPQGQAVMMALKAKEMMPAQTGAFPSTAPAPGAPAAPAQARGGPVRRASGGAGGAAGSGQPMPAGMHYAAPLPSTNAGGFTAWGAPGNGPAPGAAAMPGGPMAGSYGGGFPMMGGYGGGWGGFPGGAMMPPSGGFGGYIPGAYGAMLPTMSFSAGNPGEVGPSWSPGQALLSPSSAITTAPPGFGGTPAAAPLVTPSIAAPPPAPAAVPSPAYTGVSGMWRQGGAIPRRAAGGIGLGQMADFAMRGTRNLYHPGGFIHSAVGGRTDHLPLDVPADSHVIPADVTSGLGQGNSLNGAHILDDMFHAGPWGVNAIKSRAPAPHVGAPRGPAPHFAAGGRDKTTAILAAGGEYLVRPEAVEHFGEIAKRRESQRFARKSAMEAGHDLIDDMIVRARKNIVKTMKKLPGPAKS